jgi:hypothetical protein
MLPPYEKTIAFGGALSSKLCVAVQQKYKNFKWIQQISFPGSELPSKLLLQFRRGIEPTLATAQVTLWRQIDRGRSERSAPGTSGPNLWRRNYQTKALGRKPTPIFRIFIAGIT